MSSVHRLSFLRPLLVVLSVCTVAYTRFLIRPIKSNLLLISLGDSQVDGALYALHFYWDLHVTLGTQLRQRFRDPCAHTPPCVESWDVRFFSPSYAPSFPENTTTLPTIPNVLSNVTPAGWTASQLTAPHRRQLALTGEESSGEELSSPASWSSTTRNNNNNNNN